MQLLAFFCALGLANAFQPALLSCRSGHTSSMAVSMQAGEPKKAAKKKTMPASAYPELEIDADTVETISTAFEVEAPPVEEPPTPKAAPKKAASKPDALALVSDSLFDAWNKAVSFSEENELGVKALQAFQGIVEFNDEYRPLEKAKVAIEEAVASAKKFDEEYEVTLKAQAVFLLAVDVVKEISEEMKKAPATKAAATEPKSNLRKGKRSSVASPAKKESFKMPDFKLPEVEIPDEFKKFKNPFL